MASVSGVEGPVRETGLSLPDNPRLATGTGLEASNMAEAEEGVRLSRSYFLSTLVIHLFFPLAFMPWLFSWSGLALLVLGNYLYSGLGISLCFHRTLAHRALKLPKWLERLFAILGVCNLIETPARFVATHRVHHRHTDRSGDPHSPQESWLQGHMLWVIFKEKHLDRPGMARRYAKDILADPFYAALEKGNRWLLIYLAHATIYFLAGFTVVYSTTGNVIGGCQCGASWLLWGVFLRTLFVWHTIWAVNSVAHLRGYRNHSTRDNSRNHWVVAALTNGEGWHNNHHAHPNSATFRTRWWEVDLTFLTIQGLQVLGLAREVKGPCDGHRACSDNPELQSN